MPCNFDPELVKSFQEIAEGMPVILITDSPSLETVFSSIQLPVSAYMTKPLDYNTLLMHVNNSITNY